tara:strand:- start:7058 stop:7642 length:585 start_codon:yes stop_codon:yes gene_type:complete
MEGNKQTMRVISGTLKGKSIILLKSLTTRPLKDSVKENIFNILIHSNLININLNKSNVLDLYSGTGSFGIECMSRGAKKVFFVEKDKEAAKVLQKNISNLSIKQNTVLTIDQTSNFLNLKTKEKFNIIFLDPPFAEQNFFKDLELIKKNKIYKKSHIIIIHRETKSKEKFESLFKSLIVRKYGRSKIIFGVFST